MKFIAMISLSIMSGCAMVPFMIEEVKEAVEFEKDAVEHEIELSNKDKTFVYARSYTKPVV